MLVTLSGILILVKLEQPANAEAPMLVTLFGKLTLVSDVQLFIPGYDAFTSLNVISLNFDEPLKFILTYG